MILMLCLLTLLGTYVHADTYFNYSGLVAAFTAPIIVVGYDWTQQGLLAHEAYERRALARLAQSFTGCMVVCIVTLALQASSPFSRPISPELAITSNDLVSSRSISPDLAGVPRRPPVARQTDFSRAEPLLQRHLGASLAGLHDCVA